MAEELTSTIVWNSKLRFDGRTGSGEWGEAVPLDGPPPLGDDTGMRPMELLLMSLAGCSGQTVISLVQKMRQPVTRFEVRLRGKKTEDHPRVFSEIAMEFVFGGEGLQKESLEKAIRMSEERYCGVWNMLSRSCTLTSTYRIE